VLFACSIFLVFAACQSIPWKTPYWEICCDHITALNFYEM